MQKDNKEIYDRLDKTVQNAEYAFWAVVAEEYQEIKTGDCDPFESVKFTEMLKRQVISWWINNYDGARSLSDFKKKEEAYQKYLWG